LYYLLRNYKQVPQIKSMIFLEAQGYIACLAIQPLSSLQSHVGLPTSKFADGSSWVWSGCCRPAHMLLLQINYIPGVYVKDTSSTPSTPHSYCLLIPLINLITGSFARSRLPVQSINPNDKLRGWRLHICFPSPLPSTDFAFIDKEKTRW